MASDTIRLVIHGAAGRMGRRLVALGSQDAELKLVAAIDYSEHPEQGNDAGALAGVGEIGVPLSASLDFQADAVIDFSLPEAAVAICRACVSHKTPLVMATTGMTKEQRAEIGESAQMIPLVWAPNMSMAVNLLMKLATTAGATLKNAPGGADVEIIERHHRFKEDAPSGTALRFGELIAEAMGQTKHQHGREGQTGERSRDEIGYHALRTGDNPGEHTIVFGLLGETIELTVRATNRDCYALGALMAAKFAANQGPGLYSMYDVLGLE
ncbi:MAG: 4-hydroxy-tetrahydrodipicolinate reductase [Planctomycetaceae bacterium]|nr:4-hydroxy-tetrahydrodipicolinate reductase [Planctomycetaceae bacterium]